MDAADVVELLDFFEQLSRGALNRMRGRLQLLLDRGFAKQPPCDA